MVIPPFLFMIIVCSLHDLESVCSSVKPSHIISVIDPGYEPKSPKEVQNHLILNFDDIVTISEDNTIYRLPGNTNNSAVWSAESGYGFVRQSSANHSLIVEKRNSLPQYDRSLGLIQYGKGEPSVPGYYSVRGEVEKAYAAIINGEDIKSTLDALNDEANAILADATAQ